MGKSKTAKSWYVRLEKINTSNEEYLAYLLDKRRHKGQTITPLNDANELRYLMDELEADKEYYKTTMKRGGHIPSSLYAGVLTLPTDIDLKPEIYKKICEDTFREFFIYALKNQKKNAIEEPTEAQISDLMKKTLLIQHKGNHVHFGLPKIIREPRMVIDYSFKRMAHNLKKIFEEKVFNHTKISRLKYEVKQAEEKQNQKNKRIDNFQNLQKLEIDNYEKVVKERLKLEIENSRKEIAKLRKYTLIENDIIDLINKIDIKIRIDKGTPENSEIKAVLDSLVLLGDDKILKGKDFATLTNYYKNENTIKAGKLLSKIKKYLLNNNQGDGTITK